MTTDVIQVDIPHAPRTSRLLLLFRGILLIPQYLFGMAVTLVAAVLMLVNYLAVLITGRAACFGYLSGAMRYAARVQAYTLFLTDTYPPFSLGEHTEYPVQVFIPQPDRVHRWRVLSYFLAIPHIIVLYVLMIFAMICSVIAWVVALVIGHYPGGLFNLVSSAVRYQVRVNAYIWCITEGYPPFAFS